MIKVSSRFLAVLMLAVLAVTDVTTTSAFAQRGAVIRIRPPGHVELPWRHDHPLGSDPINRGRVLENLGLDPWSGETCKLGCEAKRYLDSAPPEESSQGGGVLRPYRSPDPILR
jgi:hypothetical protein